MAISKRKRELISEKYNGKCAFCGCDLGRGWHIWDIEPIQAVVLNDGTMSSINENEENLMPACKPCGSLRIRSSSHKMTIEEFRESVAQSFEFLRYGGITATSYGRAIRFGLLIETGKEIKFYFETYQQQCQLP